MRDSKEIGNQGEAIAKQYLIDHGYEIVATNWHCRGGEIDIIAKQGERLVFIEVKTRQAQTVDDVFTSITEKKQARLLVAIYAYLETLADDVVWRVDVIGIALNKLASVPIIDHVEDALAW